MPLAKTQPQFGSARIVSEKTIFAKPSTMKKTIKKSAKVATASPGRRRKSTPTINKTAIWNRRLARA